MQFRGIYKGSTKPNYGRLREPSARDSNHGLALLSTSYNYQQLRHLMVSI